MGIRGVKKGDIYPWIFVASEVDEWGSAYNSRIPAIEFAEDLDK